MPICKGSTKIADTGKHGIYFENKPINAVYKGSRRVYQYKPAPQTFNAGSSLVQYVVPKGISKLAIDCVASKGANAKKAGGNGGRVTCTLSVTAGQILYVTVGTIPTSFNNRIYNASDIRIGGTEYANRVVVAGGGGSSGNADDYGNNYGGAGGGTTGQTGGNARGAYGGGGGTQSAGGAGGGWADVGAQGYAGTLGLGGTSRENSGCGGAGYYGGGSGGVYTFYTSLGGGGGGGSSYTHPTLCTNVVHTQGYRNGAGYITITVIG